MKIGLFGIYGVYNFGCEAIVRGAQRFINKIYPDSEIIYFSFNYAYDYKMLKDINIDVTPVIENKNLVNRIGNKLLTIFNQDRHILDYNYKDIICSVDLIISIGGDIYTIPQYLREKRRYPYYNSLVDFCDHVVNAKKDVIVYGASVGPFGNYRKAINYYVDAMSKYKAIICREEETIEYLKKIGLNNMYLFPDPAFQVKIDYRTKNIKKYIGVNLSPLSIKEIYGKCDIETIKKMSKLMDKLCETFNSKLLFIPHVVSSSELDNDQMFLECIKRNMKNCNCVDMADVSRGFLGIKEQLHSCRLVVAARMHCAVNAIVENIPTIFLSYSQKSIGMSNYVYKNNKWLLDIKKIDKELIKVVTNMMIEEKALYEFLVHRNEEIDNYYERKVEYMKEKLLN